MKKRLLILSFALALLASGCAPSQDQAKDTKADQGASTQVSDSQKDADMKKDADKAAEADKAQAQDTAVQGDYLKTFQYSNLYDKETQGYVAKALIDGGLSQASINNFMMDVDEFNKVVTDKSLVKSGFSESSGLVVEYDVVDMMEKLESADPDAIGNNCRITTFGLMHDIINVSNGADVASDNLVFDFASIDYAQKLDEKEVEKFSTIFGKVPTEMVQDTEFQLEQVKKAWKERGITFKEGIKASMISVLFHDEPLTEGEKSYLFVGHVGVLVPVEDGKFLFVEKLTFQEPYQAILFDSKLHLNDYLMNKYDVSWGQPTARPIIMENGELLEGYRFNPNNQENN